MGRDRFNLSGSGERKGNKRGFGDRWSTGVWWAGSGDCFGAIGANPGGRMLLLYQLSYMETAIMKMRFWNYPIL